jgi:hypothetical protein
MDRDALPGSGPYHFMVITDERGQWIFWDDYDGTDRLDYALMCHEEFEGWHPDD